MKWKNKGHEFDKVMEHFGKPEQIFYLWGAKETGKRFLAENKDTLRIKGFVDSNSALWGAKLDSLEVFPPSVLQEDKEAKVIVTIFSPNLRNEVMKYLDKRGYVRYKEYISSYDMRYIKKFFVDDEIVLYLYDLMITDSCTLKCEKCVSQIPHMKKRRGNRAFGEIKEELENVFSVIDFIEDFHIIGGEPLLHPQLSEIILFVREKYSDKIGKFSLVSNSTIVPSRNLLLTLRNCNIDFFMSNYELSKEFKGKQYTQDIAKLLNEYDIPFEIWDRKSVWYDYQGDGTTNVEMIEKTYDTCPCRGKNVFLWNGFFHMCAVEFMRVYGEMIDFDSMNALSIDDVKRNRVLLLEFLLGFCELGFLSECKTCAGKELIMDRLIPAAKQMEAGR